MKNKKALLIVIAVVVFALGIGIGAYAASTFGTQADPLVAKSYLDNVLTPSLQSKYQSQLDTEVEALEKKIAGLSGDEAGNFKVVSLSSGQALKAAAGCEVILTSGAASVSSGSFSDVTSGSALSSGALSANHLCVAASDGSTVTASGAVSLLIRGSYTV